MQAKENKELTQDINDFNNNKSKEKFTEILNKYSFYDNRPKCRICGNDIYYPNILLSDKNHKHPLISRGTSMNSAKTMLNGITYKLTVCYDCMCKQFGDEYKKKADTTNKIYNTCNKFSEFAFNIPHDILKEKSKDSCSFTLDKCIKKYGKEEGERRWKHYCDLQALTNTFEYKQEKYGMTKEEFKAYNRSRACTLANFIRRYGEEIGTKRWNEYVKQESYTNTREYFIETYGEERGLEKWSNFNESRFIRRSYSQVSQDLFNRLSVLELFKNNEIYYATKNYEYEVFDSSLGKLYYLDYYDKTLNICIEFNGNGFHPSPEKYKENDIFKGPYDKEEKLCKDIWNKENLRFQYLKDVLGTDTIVVWEKDYVKNHENETIELLVQKINNIIENRK